MEGSPCALSIQGWGAEGTLQSSKLPTLGSQDKQGGWETDETGYLQELPKNSSPMGGEPAPMCKPPCPV